jgi:hypothetical protein
VAAALLLVALPVLAAETADPIGDSYPVAGRTLDLVSIQAEIVSGVLSVRGTTTPGSGAVNGDFSAGNLLVPGSIAVPLTPIYRIAMDLDLDPATGLTDLFSGAIGAEILLEVNAGRHYPTGDPAHGVKRAEPFLSAVLRRFNFDGVGLLPEVLDVPVERNPDGFSIDVPLAFLDHDGVLDLRVTALLLWAGGTCQTADVPTVCLSAPDAAPDLDKPSLRVVPEEDVELGIELDSETPLVSAVVDPQSVEVVYGLQNEKAFLWRQNDTGTGAEIRLQLFGSSNEAASGPLLANQSAGMHALPTAAFDDVGDLVVFWREEEGTAVATWEGRSAIAVGSSVLGRRFSRTGTTQGSELVVTTGGPDDSQAPSVATDGAGNSLVTWRDSDALRALSVRRTPSCPPELHCPTFDSPSHDALALAGERASVPQSAASASGEAVVVWQETAGGQSSILGRRFKNGDPIGGPFPISNTDQPTAPTVGVNDRGEFVVAWEAGGGNRHVKSQRFGPDAMPMGAPLRVHDQSAASQRFPRIDVNAKGTFAVVWQEISGNDRSILGRGFRSNEIPLGDVVEIAGPENGTLPGDPDVALSDTDEITVAYERRATDGTPRGLYRRRARLAKRAAAPEEPAPPDGGGTSACVPTNTTFCLNGGRFEVTVDWRTIEGLTGVGRAVPGASDTSTNVWFYSPDNWELTVKVLTGCQFTSHYWVMVASASDLAYVAYDVRVRDTSTGQVRVYPSATSDFGRVIDFYAFSSCSSESKPPGDSESSASEELAREAGRRRGELAARIVDAESSESRYVDGAVVAHSAGIQACSASNSTFCLNGGRFEVTVEWQTIEGLTGVGRGVPGASDTSTNIWFYSPDNWELMVKVLTGCQFTNHYWVFVSSASDLAYVNYDVLVRDTLTGMVKTYPSATSQSGRVIDFYAFPGCGS